MLATAVLLALSNVALARVANSAVPGELLYPVDRAYEWIGGRFGTRDHTPERVSEAVELLESGETDQALSLVSEMLGGTALGERLESDLVALVGSSNSQEVRDQVSDLVAAAAQVHIAAQSGDHEALQAAIDSVKEEAADVAATAGNDPSGAENPSTTAPGQVEPSPSDTAPGQVDNPANSIPSDTAPGQVEPSPSDTAPGADQAADKAGNSQNNSSGGQGRGRGNSNP